MKKVALLIVSIIFFSTSSICLSQGIPKRDTTLLEIETNYKNLSENYKNLLTDYKKLSEKVIEIEKVSDKALVENSGLSNQASSLIDWSSYVFTIFTALLAIVSIYTVVQINDIRKTKEEFRNLLNKMKSTLDRKNNDFESKLNEKVNDFDKIKGQFELEQKKSLKLLFPLIEGRIQFINGDYNGALKLFTEANIIEPNHPNILKPLYWLISNTGRLEEAIIKLERLHIDKPDNKIITNRLAEAYRRNKEYDKAQATVKDLAIIEKYPQSLYEYGAILQGKQEYIDAEKFFIESNRYYLVEDGVERYWVYLSIALLQYVNKKASESLYNAKKTLYLSKKALIKTPNNSQCFITLCIAQILVNVNHPRAEYNLKIAIKNNLPVGLAESAIEKLNLIEANRTSTVTEKVRDLLNKHIYNINNNEDLDEDLQ